MFELFNDDCFNILPKIKSKSVDLVLVDLPYGQTACKWDSVIDLKKMWVELKKCCKRKCIYVFFTTTKFGYKIIQSNEKWFRYDLVWEKSRKVGFLSANKMPLRKHELVYVFADNNTNDLDNEYNLNLRNYFKQIKNYIGLTLKQITNKIGRKAEHCFYITSSQFGLPTENTYNDLIKEYKINEMKGFREYKSLKDEWFMPENTYNPQKTKGKPFKVKGSKLKNNCVYGSGSVPTHENKTGDRHPTSILHYPETPEGKEPREHEMVYLFCNKEENNPLDFNQPIRDYAQQIKKYINKPMKEIIGVVNNSGITHFFTKGVQFRMILKKDYNVLIKEYKINEMKGFREYKSLKNEWFMPENTYNPQKTKGKPYKVKGSKLKNNCVYGNDNVPTHGNKTGDRHPTTIVKFNNPKKSLHRTQKPVDLCEWLIKSYTNENDLVLDFTMGSGTTGVACKNTNRQFIGIEKDKKIFEIAFKRIQEVLI